LFNIEEILFKAFQSKINILESKHLSIRIPKLENLIKYLCDKMASSKSGKFLIIVSKNIPSYLKYLKNEIEEDSGLRLETFVSKPQFEAGRFEQLNRQKSFDCLIVNHNVGIYEYAQNFQSVIAYDKSETPENEANQLKEICSRFDIEYIEFEVYKFESRLAVANDVKIREMENYQIIVTSKILRISHLVEFLETNMNIELIKRDYSIFDKLFKSSQKQLTRQICDVDVLFDEISGLVLVDISAFFWNGEFNTEWLTDKISHYRYSLQTVYVVISGLNGHLSSTDQLKLTDVDRILRDFKKSLFWTQESDNSFDVKLVILEDETSLTKLIVNIIRSRREERKNYELAYPNLSETMSEDEFLLISSGCFNSFSAQYVLSKTNLVDFLDYAYNIDGLRLRYPLILPKTALVYFKM
jgi:hypothetical protein